MLKNMNYDNVEYYGLYLYGKIMSYTQPLINNLYGNYFEIDEIIPNVFISDFASACETDKLQKIGITHIITVVIGIDEMYPKIFNYMIINICDRKHVQIYDYFDDSSNFIKKALDNNGKVLIHCQKGISRSATILCAYLIKYKNFTTDNAIKLLKEKRKCISPNIGFIEQLKKYENDNNYDIKKDKKNDKNEM